MARELAEFQILQAYDTSHAVAKGGSRWSDLQASANVLATNWVSMGSQLGYDPRDTRITYSSIYFTMQPPWAIVHAAQPVHGPFVVGVISAALV